MSVNFEASLAKAYDFFAQPHTHPTSSTNDMFKILIHSLIVCLLCNVGWASFPQLSIILPRGVQRGGERELTFQGARLADTVEILFHSRDAFQVRKIEPINENSIKATILIPENCALGEHIVQLRTKTGISDFRSFMVGALPILDEKEPNGSLAEAQPIDKSLTVHGVVENEDVDFYAISAKKGQRISVDIEAMRLGSALFDPYIAILDDKRFELTAVDDAPIAQQDGVLSILAPEDGQYFVQVRETSYGGNGNCRYRLHIGSFPRPTAVYPPGGKAGQTVQVKYLRDASGDIAAQVTVPQEELPFQLFPSDSSGICPSGLPFRVSQLNNALEQEPNNELAAANGGAIGQAFNGIINSPGDVDCFKFTAKEGYEYDIECYARRIRSGLDPVMNLYHADGRSIAANDDSRGPDSYFRFRVPADGDYVIRVTDHLGRGQSDFVYRVEVQPIKPSLELSIPRVDRYSQTRQTIFVPKGNRFATLINATRVNFSGELIVDTAQLPKGITATLQPLSGRSASLPVVFEAAPDAELTGKLITLDARHEETGVRGPFVNRADFILGPPNNAVYYTGFVNKLAIAVIEALPFHIEIVQPQVPIVRNGTMDLKIRVIRDGDFKEAINIEFPFRPPGIGAGSSVQIPGDKNEVVYQLNANSVAALGKWPVYVIGQANVKGAPAWAASQMAELEIDEPFTVGTLARASCEQGQTAQIVCKLKQVRPFEGETTARLVGLPPNTSAPELKFKQDASEIVFEVTTNAQSPVGKHKTPFVQMITVVKGETILNSSNATELQIDAPIVKSTPAPAAPTQTASAPPPSAPTEKPLSRLEKLRLQAKQSQASGE